MTTVRKKWRAIAVMRSSTARMASRRPRARLSHVPPLKATHLRAATPAHGPGRRDPARATHEIEFGRRTRRLPKHGGRNRARYLVAPRCRRVFPAGCSPAACRRASTAVPNPPCRLHQGNRRSRSRRRPRRTVPIELHGDFGTQADAVRRVAKLGLASIAQGGLARIAKAKKRGERVGTFSEW